MYIKKTIFATEVIYKYVTSFKEQFEMSHVPILIANKTYSFNLNTAAKTDAVVMSLMTKLTCIVLPFVIRFALGVKRIIFN